MKECREAAKVVGALLGNDDVRRATLFISSTFTVKASRRRRPDKRAKAETYLVTFGSPNFAERKFIKDCKKAGQRLPEQVRLTLWPKKRKLQG